MEDRTILLQFKDNATVNESGLFDPGGNKAGLVIEGLGQNCLRLSDYFFNKIQAAGIPTHFISSDIAHAAMTVRPVTMFGKGLEVICRFKAFGSFIRRYGAYAQEGQVLDALVEITIKDDGRGDPLITQDALEGLGILKTGEFEILKGMTQKIAALVKSDLAEKNMDLYDIKLEFGRAKDTGEIILADEISAGSMRVFKDGKKVEPMELTRLVLA